MSTTKIACVTGAAQGIGRAIALRLAADGCDISVGDLSSKLPLLEELVNEIKGKGRKAIAIAVDVSKEADVDNFVASTVKHLGGLDIMVANAGVGTLGNIIDTTVEELERVHAVNVKGTFVCYKAAAKTMISQGRGGVIIGASSLAGKESVYGSSKFAVRAITQAAAMEWGKHGIRVNGYAPGATDTPLLADMDVVFGNLIGAPPNTYKEIMKGQAALGGIVTPEAIAGVVSFLASKDAESMTGQTLCVDGGIWFD
ncbi:Diacetyl reductase [Mycena sanguinolenta]|uniref:Diacetyl reductase n=1 Tax=Mycena sanguinolenta TaxID=230812 RepID=A0A8H6XGU0_9AGAR|nr:Diacetyl reductase [Mycena sanguinolenta]